jgi:hypothetical protein
MAAGDAQTVFFCGVGAELSLGTAVLGDEAETRDEKRE